MFVENPSGKDLTPSVKSTIIVSASPRCLQYTFIKYFSDDVLENKIPTLLDGSANKAIAYAANELFKGEVIGVQSK